jgi:hypothetical protein
MAIADLHKAKLARGYLAGHLGHLAHAVGLQDTALHDAESACSCPRHTLQESTPVNAIVVVIVHQLIVGPCGHKFLLDVSFLQYFVSLNFHHRPSASALKRAAQVCLTKGFLRRSWTCFMYADHGPSGFIPPTRTVNLFANFRKYGRNGNRVMA